MTEPFDWDKAGMPNPSEVLLRCAEIMGGMDAWHDSVSAEYRAMKTRWDKDVNTIGRILRAHLHVEYYLMQYLRYTNPKLGDLSRDKGPTFYFSHKLAMLRADDPAVTELLPGIRLLNTVRNRLAHNLDAGVTEEDAKKFLVGSFKAMREMKVEGARVSGPEPIDVLEDFAEYASSMLNAPTSPHHRAFKQALEELTKQL